MAFDSQILLTFIFNFTYFILLLKTLNLLSLFAFMGSFLISTFYFSPSPLSLSIFPNFLITLYT